MSFRVMFWFETMNSGKQTNDICAYMKHLMKQKCTHGTNASINENKCFVNNQQRSTSQLYIYLHILNKNKKLY